MTVTLCLPNTLSTEHPEGLYKWKLFFQKIVHIKERVAMFSCSEPKRKTSLFTIFSAISRASLCLPRRDKHRAWPSWTSRLMAMLLAGKSSRQSEYSHRAFYECDRKKSQQNREIFAFKSKPDSTFSLWLESQREFRTWSPHLHFSRLSYYLCEQETRPQDYTAKPRWWWAASILAHV